MINQVANMRHLQSQSPNYWYTLSTNDSNIHIELRI